MIDIMWLGLMLSGLFVVSIEGNATKLTQSIVTSAQLGVETAIGLIGTMALWLGIIKIAERAGLMNALGRALMPLIRSLFSSVPANHPALGAIVMNISANLLGLGSAATPTGLKAMAELQKLNKAKEEASDAMCTLLALNTSGLTLVPATVIALRASTGSANPTDIVGATMIASTASTIAAILADAFLRRKGQKR